MSPRINNAPKVREKENKQTKESNSIEVLESLNFMDSMNKQCFPVQRIHCLCSKNQLQRAAEINEDVYEDFNNRK